MSMLSAPGLIGLGLVLGLRHAADPDHVVAVTALAARTRRLMPALALGVWWGIGHSITVFAVGAGIILFHWVVPPRLGLAMEFAVGIVLVSVGLLNLSRPADSGFGRGTPPAGRAFGVGLVHGLAGSAAIALLVLATVSDVRWACVYLLVFGIGTLLGMGLVTAGFAVPARAVVGRWGGVSPVLRAVTGVISLGFGIWVVWQIGWRDGLFLAVPHWQPR